MYYPNLTDARVLRRCREALGMTLAVLSADKPRQLGSKFIQKHYGKTNNPLSNWMRDQMLICVDESYNIRTHDCKTYVYRQSGVDFIRQVTGRDEFYDSNRNMSYAKQKSISEVNLGIEWAEQTYQEQFESGFTYEDKSNRLWNPIQNLPSKCRTKLLAKHNFRYDYDISCAAPTLLYQYSRTIQLKLNSRGKWLQGPNPEVLEFLENYLTNRKHIRQQIAMEADLDYQVVKQLINGMFAGGILGCNKRFQLFRLIGCDYARMTFLQQHPFIIGLKADIQTMWSYIKPSIPDRDKHTRRDGVLTVNSKTKWNIYFQLERQVLNEVRSYLALPEVNNRYFLIHDGFTTQRPIDVVDLSYWVEAGTGYQVTFDNNGPASLDQHIQESSIPYAHLQTSNKQDKRYNLPPLTPLCATSFETQDYNAKQPEGITI
tara:strand:+ start:336 stop:1625 length:1290 start_codon:yes stop_codon:yes gene_type:complete